MARLELENVSVDFPVYDARAKSLKSSLLALGSGGRLGQDAKRHVTVRALKELSIALRDGDRLGLIGHNGAGKTTLLRVLSGVYEPCRGRVVRQGRVASLIDITFGMSWDNTGWENILICGLHQGLDRRMLRDRAEEIAAFTGLGDFLHMPVRTYSSGMYFRLAFAISTCIEPEILLMDEWISAGDADFVEKVEERLNGFVTRSSILVLASHDLGLLRRMCNKALLLDQGRIVAQGPIEQVLEIYEGKAAA